MKKQYKLEIILSVILVVLVGITFFYFNSKPKQETSSQEPEKLVGDLNNEGIILTHISQIEQEGYQVIHYGYNYSVGRAILKMKSTGNLKEQLWVALESLGIIYPNALTYSIEIKDGRYICDYNIDGKFYKDKLRDLLPFRNFKSPNGSIVIRDEYAKRKYVDKAFLQSYVDEAFIWIDYIIQNHRVCVY